LHGNDGCVSPRAAARIAFQPHAVFKLQRQCGKKNRMLRAAKFQNGGLSKLGPSAAEGGNLHGDANGNGTRKKARELRRAIQFALADSSFS